MTRAKVVMIKNSYVRFVERVHLLRPVDLDLRDIFSRKRDFEVLVVV
jgi:hypothetical protein